MGQWKFFDITHREHVICNPMSVEKPEGLAELLRLEPATRVLEIATGKGEFILKLAERYDIQGIGVDLSPHFVAEARRKHPQRVPDAQLTFDEMDGADFAAEEAGTYGLAACIGASWIFGGHKATLKALDGMAAPTSWVVVGEPYWRQEPYARYLEALGQERGAFGSHCENAEAGRELGLDLVCTVASDRDDWDRYEGLQWYAAGRWAHDHPGDPDVGEVLTRVHQDRDKYLRWGRETLGWAIYVFRKDVPEGRGLPRPSTTSDRADV